MKTDDLIQLLAQGAGPAPSAVAARRLVPGAGIGLVASALLSALLIGWVPADFYAGVAPWFKLIYMGLLALAAAWLVARLGRPVPRAEGPLIAVAGVIAAACVVGVASWWRAAEAERWPLLMGHSSITCPWNVFVLSLPALLLALWALRGLAPTRPVAAGAAAGLFAGALGAFGYALACDELGLPFVAVWYTSGVLLTVALGALLGPKLLRW